MVYGWYTGEFLTKYGNVYNKRDDIYRDRTVVKEGEGTMEEE